MSEYYVPSSDPADNSDAEPSVLRAEHLSISAGFDKLAALAGHGSEFVTINAGATAQTSITASAARTALSLVIGTNVQAWDADLDAIAALAKTDSNFIVGNGSTWVAESGATVRTSLGLTIGTDVQAYDADTAKLDVEDQALTGGVIVTSKSLGTISSGTVTPDPGDRPQQHYTNGGAHTLGVSANAGSVLVDITNDGSAGAITTSGFTRVAGDSFTTTNGHKFRVHISIGNAGSLLSVQALQ